VGVANFIFNQSIGIDETTGHSIGIDEKTTLMLKFVF